MSEPLTRSQKQQVLRANRKARGLCVGCDSPLVNATHCEFHRDRHNEIKRRHQARRPRGRFLVCNRCEAPVGTRGSFTGLCQPCATHLIGLTMVAVEGALRFGSKREPLGILGVTIEDEREFAEFFAGDEPQAVAVEPIDDHRQREPATSAWSDDCADDERLAS